MAAGLPACLRHLFFCNALIAKAKVFPDRSTEQIGVLHDHGDIGKKAVRLNFFDIPAIHSDMAGLIIPKPCHQTKQCGFPASRWAYQSGQQAGGRIK